MSAYTDRGYENRRDYLESLALDYDIPKSTVFSLASFLGQNEDFDGLISTLDDYEYMDF